MPNWMRLENIKIDNFLQAGKIEQSRILLKILQTIFRSKQKSAQWLKIRKRVVHGVFGWIL